MRVRVRLQNLGGSTYCFAGRRALGDVALAGIGAREELSGRNCSKEKGEDGGGLHDDDVG
jgi:hypothetical protein